MLAEMLGEITRLPTQPKLARFSASLRACSRGLKEIYRLELHIKIHFLNFSPSGFTMTLSIHIIEQLLYIHILVRFRTAQVNQLV